MKKKIVDNLDSQELLINTIDLCLFDIDYTLVSGYKAKRYYSQYSKLIEKIYANQLDIRYAKAKQLVNQFRKENNGNGELILNKYNLQWIWYNEILKLNPSSYIKPNSGVLNLLKTLKRKGIKLGAVTDGPIEQVNKIFRASNIDPQLFDIVVGWEKKKLKPKNGNSKIFIEICKKLKVKPSRTLMVGDSLTVDILPAVKAKLKTVYFKPNVKSPNQKIYTIRSLEDLLCLKNMEEEYE